MFMSVLVIRFRNFTDFPKPSCSSVKLLFLSQMEATNRFSEAAWELETAFLKPREECTQISRRL
jgi:hypothetical protein